MIELETLQTLFLALIAVIGSIGTILATFVLKKLGCFDNMFRSHAERITALETKAAINHPKK